MLRSSGAAGRALQIRIKPKTPKLLPNLRHDRDRCYRLAVRLMTQHETSFLATSLDEAICVDGRRNEARFGALRFCVSDELLERWFQGQI